MCAAVALCVSAVAPTAGRVEPSMSGVVGIEAGHDDRLLTDPSRINQVAPVSSSLLLAFGSLDMEWRSHTIGTSRVPSWRLRLETEAASSTYPAEKASGGDRDLRGGVVYRHHIRPRLAFDARARALRFRRERVSFLDLDLFAEEVRLRATRGDSWAADFHAGLAQNRFPGRLTFASRPRTEEADQLEIGTALSRATRSSGRLDVELTYRRNDSNESAFDWNAAIAALRYGTPDHSPHAMAAFMVWSHRTYPHYEVVREASSGDAAGGVRRRDLDLQFGIEAGRRIVGNTFGIGRVYWLHQDSNAAGLDLDQVRWTVGVRVAFGSDAVRETVSLPFPVNRVDSASAQTDSGGIVFRCNAPGARTVCVVGTWNHWDPTRTPLEDADHDGRWQAVVAIPPGRWRYAYLIDGVWTRPEGAAAYEDDGFGGTDGVVDVPFP